MHYAIPYFAVYTFFWLFFSLGVLEYYVTYLRLTQIYQVVQCSPPPKGRFYGATTSLIMSSLFWIESMLLFHILVMTIHSASYCWLHMHQDITLCYVNCTCGNRLQHVLNGWKSFPVVFAQINIEFIVCLSDLWWKMTLEFYHYKLRVLLCYYMLGKKGRKVDLGKQFKILRERCIKMVKNLFDRELKCFIHGKCLLLGNILKA